MHFRFLDILVSLLGFVALLEKHNFLFASIASICTIIYWIFRFCNWVIKLITDKSIDDFEKGIKKMTNISLKNYFEPTPKNVKKWLLAIKSILATISVSAYVNGNEKIAFWILVGGACIDELTNLLSNDNA